MNAEVVYPGQADREVAQTAGLARYWEAHARELERQAREAEQVKAQTQTPPPVRPPPAPPAQPQPVPPESPPAPPAKGGSFNWAWIPMVVAMLGVSAYFKAQKAEEKRRAELFAQQMAAIDEPGAAERVLSILNRKPFEPEMLAIPAGSFTMGSPDSEPDRDPDEGPQHKVQVASFELGKYEVTFAQWDTCVDDGGCSHRPEDGGALRGDTPVMNVSWNHITQQYLPWLNRKTGKKYRLPSEAEWEYAARAGCRTAFNVGGQCASKIEPGQANFLSNNTYNGSTKGEPLMRPSKIGSYAANNWGLHDMHGNVWEWVQDCYEDGYNKGQASDGSAHRAEDSSCGSRVLRGGSWGDGPRGLRSAGRGRYTPDFRGSGSGFRLARTVREKRLPLAT